jgi:dihydroflavonol-4-reductase
VLADGDEVRAMVYPGESQKNIEGLDLEVIEGDIMDRDSLDRAVHGCDRVYQLAAIYAHWHPKGRAHIVRVNVEGTRNLLSAARDAGVERVVYTSSVACVAFRKGRLTDENDYPEEHEYRRMPYRESKIKSEQVAVEFAKQGLPVVMVNPTAPIGVRDIRPTPTGRTILDFLNGKMVAYVDAGLNFIDVEDVAEAFVAAMHKGRIGERYILGNANLNLKEYFELVAEVTGMDPPRFKMPKLPLRVIAEINEAIANITKKEPVAAVEAAIHTTEDEYVCCDKAVNELGLKQNDIRIPIKKAVQWYLDNGYVDDSRADAVIKNME